MRRLIVYGVFLVAPIFSALQLIQARNVFQLGHLIDNDITEVELILICHFLVCAVSLWVMVELLLILRATRDTTAVVKKHQHRRLPAFLLGGLALLGHSQSVSDNGVEISEEVGVPVESVLTPAMAALLLRDILQRRRVQIRQNTVPDVLCDDEVVLLSKVQRLAADASFVNVVEELDHSLPVVKVLTEAVERIEERQLCVRGNPLFIVRLYGYPEVRSGQGERACFRKKRALELLVWLALNRDRPRRSAARTALWQIDVSDATFSTVVSDMRRGLSDLDSSMNRGEILPTTYSDELLLSHHITTDYELLRHSLGAFREDCSQYHDLAHQLGEIRDVPFSGTSYEWADLDGTTTRLIITAMQASQELAEFAKSVGDVELMMVAVSAGLRVMPGNEDLLEIQQSFIHQASLSRSIKAG
jgi:two-component SAPR family response regulator